MVTVFQGEPNHIERIKTKAGGDAWLLNSFIDQHSGRVRTIIVVERAGLVWASYATSRSWKRAAIAFRESGDDFETLGVRIIPWQSVRSIAETPAFHWIEVKYRSALGFSQAKALRTPGADASAAIFAALHERLGPDLPVQRGKARIDTIPVGAEQAGTIVLFVFAVIALIVGALYGAEGHPGGALGRDEGVVLLVGKLGEAVGPAASFTLAALAAAAAAALLVRTIRRRPERRFVRVPGGTGS